MSGFGLKAHAEARPGLDTPVLHPTQAHAAQQVFESALGARVHDEIALYEASEQQSRAQVLAMLSGAAA